MSLLPSSPRSTSSTSPSSTSSTPRAVSLAPTELQIAHPTCSDEEELRDYYRGPYASDSVQFTDHPTVRVTSTDVEENSSLRPTSNDSNDRMISRFRNRSRSPGRIITRDEGELRPQTSDHPLSHSWWGEEKHVARPKKTEQTEALQSTRKVSNNVFPDWTSSSRAPSERAFLRHSDVDQFECR